ncbi:hypothetical protein V6Z11_D07G225100 [Gossypium hirsutum]|uniref:Uncharacterized protein n=1 Tax=Gossypium hirsutum TaxID=3635 RepID=A0A1U8LBH6_GOSHI|nr:uncharacterized protein LOC107925753 [Gossypium hirsutum]
MSRHLESTNRAVMALLQPFSDAIAMENMKARHPRRFKSNPLFLQAHHAVLLLTIFYFEPLQHLSNRGLSSGYHAVVIAFELRLRYGQSSCGHQRLLVGLPGSHKYHRLKMQGFTVISSAQRPIHKSESTFHDFLKDPLTICIGWVDSEPRERGSKNLAKHAAVLQMGETETKG